jgi:hypothetical protein
VFACYSFEQLSGFPERKLKVLFIEAQRQLASQASMTALLFNKPNQEDSVQAKISKYIDSLTDPYKIVGLDDSGWDVLRARKHIK